MTRLGGLMVGLTLAGCGSSAPSTTSSPASTTPTPLALPAPVNLPKSGTYTIVQTGTLKLSFTETVTPVGVDGYTVHDVSQQIDATYTYAVRPDGVYLTAEVVGGSACTIPQPALEFPNPVRAGASWHPDVTCGGSPIDLIQRVVGVEVITIAGQRVEVIRIDARNPSDPSGTNGAFSQYFDPKRGLVLRSTARGGTGAAQFSTERSVTTLPPL